MVAIVEEVFMEVHTLELLIGVVVYSKVKLPVVLDEDQATTTLVLSAIMLPMIGA